MKHLFALAAPAALLLFLAPASALAYSSTQSVSGSAAGFNGTVTFTGMPAATGNVTISVTQYGDFGHSTEYSTVFADGTNLGTINPSQSNVNCVTESGSFSVGASYVADGALTVLVDATSNVNICNPVQYTITVTYSEGTPPTANAGGPYSVNQGTALTLDGGGSTANTGSLSLYEWDCTNNGSYDVSSTSPTGSTCTYPNVGAYTVRLRVTNSAGLTDIANANVTVTNTAPVADAGGPYTVNQGLALAVDGGASVDPDGGITLYAWDCTTDGSYDSSSSSATSSPCTYPDVGAYTLTLQVTDDDGATATASTSVSVTNTLPVADAGGPYASTKGVPVSVSGTLSGDADGLLVEYAWDCDNDGTYELTSASPAATCTFGAVGSYTVGLRVTDDDGGQGTDVASVAVGNDPPSADASGPYSGAEGTPIALSAAASADVPPGTLSLYEWDCTTDGSFELSSASPTAACVYPDDGSYTATLRVTDDDGAQATATASVSVSNLAPTVSLSVPATGVEGAAVAFSASGSDASPVDQAALSYAWTVTDPGGATLFSSSSASASFAFADDGTYTLTVVVTDPQGATASGSATVSIGNADPSFVSFGGPLTGDEGSSLSFLASVTDPGTADQAGLVLTWTWGDGTASDTGLAPVHTWDDDGVYTVTAVLTDDDGGSATQTLNVTINNVAPAITTSAPTNALEGVQYSYQPALVDPGSEVFAWSLSPSAPAGMTVDASTGLLQWTPTYEQSLSGSFSIVLTVNDGDGGLDAQSFTVTVLSADADGDGIADSWELDNGLDPTDPTDGAADPDADGLSNLHEFGQGTDPNVYDGPTLPALVSPVAGDEVATDRPDLLLDNATDPQNDVLVYEFEVYSDAALTALVTASTPVVEDASGQTSWKVDLPLSENASYWWRARVSDPFVTSAWTTEEGFFVNTVEEAPSAPVLVYPIGGETASSLTPELVWTEALDPDGDALTYEVEVWDALGAPVAFASDVAGDGLEARWTVDVALLEDAVYTWTARAVDEHGVLGADALPEDFFVDTDNAAPSESYFLDPVDGMSLSSVPALQASEGVDPEGGPLVYRFELDSVASFDSADLLEATVPGTETGSVSWNLAAEGVFLRENAWTWARVRAIDEGGVSSVPDTIQFFVRGENDAPSVPVLLSPADGGEGSSNPVFSIEDPIDPEGDGVYLDVVVARDAELTDIIDEVGGLLVPGLGAVQWTPALALQGTVYWTARAIDAEGAASAWATPFRYEAPSEALPPGDDDDDDAAAGCDCASSVLPSTGGSGLGLLLLGGLLLRRRRA